MVMRSDLIAQTKSQKMSAEAAAKRQLPKKDYELYRTIAKHYETKQYKKGVKVIKIKKSLLFFFLKTFFQILG
jgi:hypothetical protein